LTVLVPLSQPLEDLITDNGKMEDILSLSIPDHYEQWLAFHHDNPIWKFIKIIQGLLDFEVWLNKEKHVFLGWSILKRNSKLIKLGKGSSTSHPGQGLFRHLGSCGIHELAGSIAFYLIHLDGEPMNIPRNGQQLKLFFK
jgi:hypothetical protein